ncbi:MAG: hypothetical protein ACOYYJ_08565 [Chloroflexota bacterium]
MNKLPKNSIYNTIKAVLLVGFSLLVYSLILLNRFPNFLRPLSMFVRTGYTLAAPVLFVFFYIAFRLRGGLGKFFSLAFTLAVFALALAGAWAAGTTESGILSGVVPMFDSASYYVDALRLLAGDEFSVTSSRRPLFIALFAVLLFISQHNLMIALGILNLFVAVSCYLLAREIQRTHGAGIAVFALLILFMYYRFHSGAVRTESLGVALSALGAAFFWRSVVQQQGRLALVGIFLTAFAMIARAGTFFSLPLLVLWGSWVFRQPGRKFSWIFALSGIGLVLGAFFFNQLVTQAFGTREAVPFGNFSYSFYGLASGGKSWAEVQKVHPGADDLEIYRLAFDLIRERPGLIVQGALYNWKIFFSNSNYGLFSFMGGETLASATISHWLLVGLSCLGIISWLRNPKDHFASFVIVAAAGVFISVPFLPPTDAFRVRAYAASIVVIGLLPGLGLHFLLRRFRDFHLPPQVDFPASFALPGFSAAFLGLVLLGPFLLHGVEPSPALPPTGCPAGMTSLIVRYDPGTMIHLVPQKTQVLEWAPVYKTGGFQRNLHDFPSFAFAGWASEIKPGYSLFYALDWRASGMALIVLPTAPLPDPPAILEVCGKWETEPEIAQFFAFDAQFSTKVGMP